MAIKNSAGILVHYTNSEGEKRVLLVHSSGREDQEAWSIPKGEFSPQFETPMQAAIREVHEELGIAVRAEELVSLGESVYRNKSKRVYCFAWDAKAPPLLIPDHREISRAEFFRMDEARRKLHRAQVVFLDRLATEVGP